MKIHVHNRRQVEALLPRPNVWVISIHTPGDKPANLYPDWERVDRFCFSDIAGDSSEVLLWVQELRAKGREVILFNKEMANEIREIIALARFKGKDLVVHCDAGVSRSQGVARFAREVFGCDVVSHTINSDIAANGLVVRHLMRLIWEASPNFVTHKGTFTWEPEEEDDEWNKQG